MSAADELRVVLAGATSGVDAGRLARRHGCGSLLRAGPGTLQRMGALPALIDGLRLAREADVAAYRRGLLERGHRVRDRLRAGVPGAAAGAARSAAGPVLVGRRALTRWTWPAPVAAIVGSRKASDAGLLLAQRLAGAVAEAGGVVVSGLALGIDAAAHRGALAAGGVTVAVLGCGVDVVYPRSNRAVFEQIRDAGLLVSEYPPGTRPATWRFPARNRLIAALADATVVVEARARSGALITADHALDLGRDVLAVPGHSGHRVGGRHATAC